MHNRKSLFFDAVVDCGPLANISNGIAVFQATTVGFSAEIICDEGYRLNGSSTRECQEDGTYNGTEPTCLSTTH